MDTQVAIALIAAGASLLVSLLTAFFNLMRRRHEEQTSGRRELDQYREPLYRAALELAERIHNIQQRKFASMLGSENERRRLLARLSTYYRLARYWCVAELTYDQLALLRFEATQQTLPIRELLDDIGWAFATDELDSGKLMVWREEQRAIAELATIPGEARCIGFASFMHTYARTFSTWFAAFDGALTPQTARTSARLREAQFDLGMLCRKLDVDEVRKDEWNRYPPASDYAQVREFAHDTVTLRVGPDRAKRRVAKSSIPANATEDTWLVATGNEGSYAILPLGIPEPTDAAEVR
jgi:hypothetical protein